MSGYMLLALVAMGTSPFGSPGFNDGIKGILIYLLVYTFMNLGIFAVITSLRRRDIIGDEHRRSLWPLLSAPVEAVLMLLFLIVAGRHSPSSRLSGASITSSSASIESQHYWLASVAVLYALFGLYYYLRIANSMMMRWAPNTETRKSCRSAWGMRFALGLTASRPL